MHMHAYESVCAHPTGFVLLLCTVAYLPTCGYRRRFADSEARQRRNASQRETNKVAYGNCFHVIPL